MGNQPVKNEGVSSSSTNFEVSSPSDMASSLITNNPSKLQNASTNDSFDIDLKGLDEFCTRNGIIDSISYRINEIVQEFEGNFFTLCMKEEEYNKCVGKLKEEEEGRRGNRKRRAEKTKYYKFAELVQRENKLKFEKLRKTNINELFQIKNLRMQILDVLDEMEDNKDEKDEEEGEKEDEKVDIVEINEKEENVCEGILKKIKERVKNVVLCFLDQFPLFGVSLCWIVKDVRLSSLKELESMMYSQVAKAQGSPFGRYHVGIEVGSFYSHFYIDERDDGAVGTFNKQKRSYLFGKNFLRIPLFFVLPTDDIVESIIKLVLDEDGEKVTEISEKVYKHMCECVWRKNGDEDSELEEARNFEKFNPVDFVSSLKRVADKWEKKRYNKIRSNCQHYFFDIVMGMKLVEKEGLPKYFRVMDLKFRIIKKYYFSKEVVKFMKRIWVFPKNVTFEHLRVFSSLPGDFVAFVHKEVRPKEKKDPQLLKIACDFFLTKGKYSEDFDINLSCIVEFYVQVMRKYYQRIFPKLEDFKFNLSKVSLDHEIAAGGNAQVFKIMLKDGKEYAFKRPIILRPSLRRMVVREVIRVSKMYIQLYHPNIIEFKGYSLYYVTGVNRIGIILELCKDCVLDYLIESKKNNEEIPFESKLAILLEVVKGMEYLDNISVIHRDLKWENVLRTEDGRIKIADFGTSKKYVDENNTFRVGTMWYCPYEVLFGNKYTSKCDIYSFGVMAYMMLFEEYDLKSVWYKDLFEFKENPALRPNIKENFKDTPEWITPIIEMAWNPKESERPSFTYIFRFLCSEGTQAWEDAPFSLNMKDPIDNVNKGDFPPVLLNENEKINENSDSDSSENSEKENDQ